MDFVMSAPANGLHRELKDLLTSVTIPVEGGCQVDVEETGDHHFVPPALWGGCRRGPGLEDCGTSSCPSTNRGAAPLSRIEYTPWSELTARGPTSPGVSSLSAITRFKVRSQESSRSSSDGTIPSQALRPELDETTERVAPTREVFVKAIPRAFYLLREDRR